MLKGPPTTTKVLTYSIEDQHTNWKWSSYKVYK